MVDPWHLDNFRSLHCRSATGFGLQVPHNILMWSSWQMSQRESAFFWVPCNTCNMMHRRRSQTQHYWFLQFTTPQIKKLLNRNQSISERGVRYSISVLDIRVKYAHNLKKRSTSYKLPLLMQCCVFLDHACVKSAYDKLCTKCIWG